MTSVTIEGTQQHVEYLTNLLKSNGDTVTKQVTRNLWVQAGQPIIQRDLVLKQKDALDK